MIKEIVYGILGMSALIGLISYLIRQSVWIRYIQPMVSRKPDPVLRFKDNNDVVMLKESHPLDIEKMVANSMQDLKAEYPKENIRMPSFENPWPNLFDDNISNKKCYNILLDKFYNSWEQSFRNTHQGEIEDSFLEPINILIHNRGKVPCGSMKIELKIKGSEYVYLAEARRDMIGQRLSSPILCLSSMIPCLTMDNKKYDYHSWNLMKHIDDVTSYAVDSLLQNDIDSNAIPIIYVDTRQKRKILIDWKILEVSHSEPISGELVIWVGYDSTDTTIV